MPLFAVFLFPKSMFSCYRSLSPLQTVPPFRQHCQPKPPTQIPTIHHRPYNPPSRISYPNALEWILLSTLFPSFSSFPCVISSKVIVVIWPSLRPENIRTELPHSLQHHLLFSGNSKIPSTPCSTNGPALHSNTTLLGSRLFNLCQTRGYQLHTIHPLGKEPHFL